MRTYSTIGWYMAQAIGALYLDQSEDEVVRGFARGEGNVGYVLGVDRDDGRVVMKGSRRSGKRAAMKLALDQAKAECAPRNEGVTYVRG